MEIMNWYREHFENRLMGRYITLDKIQPILNRLDGAIEFSIAGYSEMDREIPLLKIGTGNKKVLAWSQMHGNESTTTKALFDLLKFLTVNSEYKTQVDEFLDCHTLYILPILNPDGAFLYTRCNANDVDLNRDAQQLTQKESQVLRAVFDRVRPDLCLNMHDQRTLFGLDNGKPATVSFLSPAADAERTITPTRQVAMEEIVKMNACLQSIIPGQVGRFDDSFNPACVGDTFQMKGVPTILFEAGHFPEDYQREKTREMVFYALLALFDILENKEEVNTQWESYHDIPENRKNFRDIILRNVMFEDKKESVDIAIQYVEKRSENRIVFEPQIDVFGDLSALHGHQEIDMEFKIIHKKANEMLITGLVIHKIRKITEGSSISFDRNVF
jgi:hypothetical protein